MKIHDDTRRMDWLEHQVVKVSTMLRWGSRDNFISSPEDGDGYIGPSDIRVKIDAAMKQEKTDGQ